MAINTESAFADAAQTVSDTALSLADFTGFTQAQIDRASLMRITVNSNTVNFRYTGTAPTTNATTGGHPLAAGNTEVIIGQDNIRNFQVIRSGGTDAAVFVTLEE